MNPYLPEYEYVPDGEPHVFGNRVYVYGSHDRFHGEKMCMNDYICYSANVSDLGKWRYEGIIYRAEQDPGMTKENRCLWAPDVVCGKDGRFYLYYCMEGVADHIGVAVCNTPAGSYTYYGTVRDAKGRPVGTRPQDTDPFDPAVFADDDGRIYLYSGNGPLFKECPPQFAGLLPPETPKGCVVMELEDDMLTIRTEPKVLIPHVKQAEGTPFEAHPFFEASSMRKIGRKYYLIYSSNKMHELCYAISDHPDREFSFGGVLVSNAEIHEKRGYDFARNAIGNNHGSILEVNGSYYLFYHRATNNHGNSRQGCAEQIVVLQDGSIPQVELTSNGMSARFDRKGKYPASCVCHLYRQDIRTDTPLELWGKELPYLTQDGPDYEPDSMTKAPRQYITNLCSNAVAVFRYFRISDVEKIILTIRADGEGRILLKQDPEAEAFAEIRIQPTADWKEYAVLLSSPVDPETLCICYEGKGTAELLEFQIF